VTLVCTVVLILHMPSVDAMARRAQTAEGNSLRALGGDLFHPGAGLLLLLAVTVLNVYKPAGLTPYGWRKQREQRRLLAVQTSNRPAVATRATVRVEEHVRQQSSTRALAEKVGNFVFYLAEMWFAMILGMAVFMVLRIALLAQGYVQLRDPASIEFLVGMGLFMVVGMAAWMRMRGCSWRECREMSSVMLLPTAAALALRGLDLQDALRWLSNSQHPLMLMGMLALMLYRREHYTRQYSLGLGADQSGRRRQELGA
jgi:hypothetical protein